MIGRVQLGAEPSDADDQHQRGRDASPQRDLGPATQGCHERQRRRHRKRYHSGLRHALPHFRIQGRYKVISRSKIYFRRSKELLLQELGGDEVLVVQDATAIASGKNSNSLKSNISPLF